MMELGARERVLSPWRRKTKAKNERKMLRREMMSSDETILFMRFAIKTRAKYSAGTCERMDRSSRDPLRTRAQIERSNVFSSLFVFCSRCWAVVLHDLHKSQAITAVVSVCATRLLISDNQSSSSPLPSSRLCSMFSWTNETVNIWTHVLGVLLLTAVLVYDVFIAQKLGPQLRDTIVAVITVFSFQV